MKSIDIKRYQPALKKQWDDFIKKSQADCLLFYRDFMEYHADRFIDHSLIFEDEKGWLAVFPAHLSERNLMSHGGLTFGGFVSRNRMDLLTHQTLVEALINYTVENDYLSVCIKVLPYIYWKEYQSKMEYFLFQKGFQLSQRYLNYVVPFNEKWSFNKTKAQLAYKGLPETLTLRETNQFQAFWLEILIPHLFDKYRAMPVHSSEEIIKLKSNFPENIRLFVCEYNGQMVAGIVVFENEQVIKIQYAAVNEMGREKQAMDYLYIHLVKKYQEGGFRYFDMGHVNTEQGRNYNPSLAKYKERLGARPINIDVYVWKR